MMTTAMDTPQEPEPTAVVQVVADGYPRIARWCPNCNRNQPFVCTGKFRVNANGKLLDIWLLYRCAKCEFTFNLTIVERANVDRVDRAFLNAAFSNDHGTAARYARDVGLLKRSKVTLESGDDWRMTSSASDLLQSASDNLLRLEFPTPLIVRLHHVLAQALGISRSRLAALERSGAFRLLTPGNGKVLRLWSSCDVEVSGRPPGNDPASNE